MSAMEPVYNTDSLVETQTSAAVVPELRERCGPTVSIILPTYNRVHFLRQAFDSIRSQTFADWELIVVDDGSTDDTPDIVAALTRDWMQPVRYVHQANQGAYGARNTGLDLARGRFIAFYDSDDVWLPHHLSGCVEALEANAEVDWVYGSYRIIDHATGQTIEPNAFYEGGRPQKFLSLQTREAGLLRIFDDPTILRCALLNTLFCPLQNSVLRGEVFHRTRFQLQPRNEGEDQVFVARLLALRGLVLGYLSDVHVEYLIHPGNASAAGAGNDFPRRIRVVRELIAGYECLRAEIPLSPSDSLALRRRLSRLYFWMLGYQLWQFNTDRCEAIAMYRKALWLWPWDVWYWKTYLLALIRCPARASR